MTRKKIKLEWIVNDSARKASLKKRRLSLLKKVSELITLCGVEAFIIIYSPDEAEPAIWPPSRSDVEQLVMRYMSMPEMERYKKMTNQESYLRERSGKIQDQGKKSQQKNKDSELSHLMFEAHDGKGLDQFETIELYGLNSLMNGRMMDIRKRMEYFQMVLPLDERFSRSEGVNMEVGDGGVNMEVGEGGVNMDVGEGGSGMGFLQGEMIQNPNQPLSWDQWFFDMAHNTETNVGGGTCNFNTGSGSDRIGLQNLPHGFGPYEPVAMSVDQLHGNIEPTGTMMYPPPFELRGGGFGKFPHANMISGGNPFDPVYPPPLTLPSPYHGGSDGADDVFMGVPPPTLPPPYHGGNGGADDGFMGMPPSTLPPHYHGGSGGNDVFRGMPPTLPPSYHGDSGGANDVFRGIPHPTLPPPYYGGSSGADNVFIGMPPTLPPHYHGGSGGVDNVFMGMPPPTLPPPYHGGCGGVDNVFMGMPPPTLPPPYHGGSSGADDVFIRMHGFYGGPYGVGAGPSASTNGLMPPNDGGNDQTGMPNYEVNNPQWPKNP